MTNPHAHHIVMKGFFNRWLAPNRAFVTGAQDILTKYGIDVVNSPTNLTWVQNSGHSVNYAEKVYLRLQRADSLPGANKATIESALTNMGKAITNGSF